MSGFRAGQLQIAQLLFDLPEARGFALAGGSALLALGTIDRPTRDIDAFVAARRPRLLPAMSARWRPPCATGCSPMAGRSRSIGS